MKTLLLIKKRSRANHLFENFKSSRFEKNKKQSAPHETRTNRPEDK